MTIPELIESIVRDFVAVIPNIVGALAVVLIGWIIARLSANFIRRIFKTIGADKLAERLNEIEIIHKSNMRIVPSILFSKLLYYVLFFIFIIAATDVLGMPAVSALMGDILNYIPNLFSAFLVFIIGIFLADFIKNIVLTTCTSLGIPAAKVIANVIFYFLFLNVVMITLSQVKIDTNFIQDNLSIILAGIVLAFAIGYGFASRQIVANFLSSFYNKEKIKLGDIIRINDVKGEVIAIDNTSFTLQTAAGRKVVVPFGKLDTETIEIFDESTQTES